MNTRFTYLYRDGSNYKSWGDVVFAGDPTNELSHRLSKALERNEFFIAEQVRVPNKFFDNWPRYDDDHCWHECGSLEATDEAQTDRYARTIEDFVTEVERAFATGWNVFDPGDHAHNRKTESAVIRDAHGPLRVVHSDAEIIGGEAVFVGTRVPVKNLFEHLEAGDSLDKFLHSFPSVSKEQAVAALEMAREALEGLAHSDR